MKDLIFLAGIINAVSDPIFVKDESHKWVLLNDAACKLFGKKRDELVGKSDFDIFPKEEAEVFWKKDNLVFSTNEENVNQEFITGSDGEQRTISTKKRIYTLDSGEKMLVGVIRDVTEEVKYASELQNKNRELESFASLAAHDLKSPLNHLHALNTMLKDMIGENKELTQLLNIIDKSTTQMRQLIENLLSYARSGKYIETPSEISLNLILEKVINNLRESIQEKQAHILIDADLPVVEAHEIALVQLFQNLIANGIKYNQSAEPMVEIRNKTSKSGISILVKDNGIGIEKKESKKIFQPLYRLHSSDVYQGTGLGLAICQKIMDFYNGNITVSSKKSEGSTFVLNFPATSITQSVKN